MIVHNPFAVYSSFTIDHQDGRLLRVITKQMIPIDVDIDAVRIVVIVKSVLVCLLTAKLQYPVVDWARGFVKPISCNCRCCSNIWGRVDPAAAWRPVNAHGEGSFGHYDRLIFLLDRVLSHFRPDFISNSIVARCLFPLDSAVIKGWRVIIQTKFVCFDLQLEKTVCRDALASSDVRRALLYSALRIVKRKSDGKCTGKRHAQDLHPLFPRGL